MSTMSYYLISVHDNNIIIIIVLPVSFCPREGSKVRPFAWNCWDSQEMSSVGERASENAVGLLATPGVVAIRKLVPGPVRVVPSTVVIASFPSYDGLPASLWHLPLSPMCVQTPLCYDTKT